MLRNMGRNMNGVACSVLKQICFEEMFILLMLLSFFSCISANHGNANGEKTLKMVHLLYRHGDRTPIGTFPTDKYQEKYWRDNFDGFGQLTKKGKNMEYNLGEFIRQRYIQNNSFINTSYLHEEVYCRSSNVDRCLMSAESQMAGLFPPAGWQIWNPNINWQPIPVHSVPSDHDPLIRPWHANCPRLKVLIDNKMQADIFVKKSEENKELLRSLSNYSGNTITLSHFWSLYDVLFVEKSHNLIEPKWLTSSLWSKMTKLSDWTFSYAFTGDAEFSRLSGGSLVKEIVQHMDNLQTNSTPNLFKLYVYSGHDTTVLALLGSLGISEYTIPAPPYASCVFLELYLLNTGKYAVQILYRNDSSRDPYRLKLHDCAHLCPLDQFTSLLKKRIPENYETECGLKESFGKSLVRYIHENMTIVIGLGLVIMLLVLVIVIMGVICSRKPSRKLRKAPQNDWTLCDTEDEESDSAAVLLDRKDSSSDAAASATMT